MISKALYRKIELKYGGVASWAIWRDASDRPKSNISDMSVFDQNVNPILFDCLKPNIVMVALNFAREVSFVLPFSNFHDPNPHGNDFKIRFAFKDTPFYGAYMTDILKNLPMISSKMVRSYLRKNPDVLEQNIKTFVAELKFIGAKNPIILAFGADAYKILKQNLDPANYRQILKLPHFSYQISKENYRKEVHDEIRSALKIVSSNTEYFAQVVENIDAYSETLASIDTDLKAQDTIQLDEMRRSLSKLLNVVDKLSNT